MKKLRIGLVGTGFIADYHYNGFLKNEDAQIAGMCAHSNLERLNSMCSGWGIKPYESFDAMVEDPSIDALVISSINPEHFPQIMKALEKGKHMLVEKPVVTDFEHLDKIIAASSGKDLVIFPGHNFVYREAVKKAKEVIESGRIGRIAHASFVGTQMLMEQHAKGWRSKKALSSGGALMDSGHHLVYMSLYLMGMPSKLQAFKSNLLFSGMECEDIAQVNLLYPDGSIGSIMQSWVCDWSDNVEGIRILGDKGQIFISDALYVNYEKINDDTDYDNSFCNQAKAFTDCILKKRSPLSGLEDVRNSLKIIYGAYKSSDENSIVEVLK